MRFKVIGIALAAIVVLVAIAGIAGAISLYSSQQRLSEKSASGLSIPDVHLVADDGRPFRFSQLRGTSYMLFFGFTHCVDTCPLTLVKLERARRSLPPSEQHLALVVFATVDPERDTPARLEHYLSRFGPGMIGITGSPMARSVLYHRLGVWYQRLGRGPNYDMSHTTTVYFVDSNGDIRSLHDWQDSQRDLDNALARLVS